MAQTSENVDLEDPDLKIALVDFANAEIEDLEPLFDQTIVDRHPSLEDMLIDDGGKLFNSFGEYILYSAFDDHSSEWDYEIVHNNENSELKIEFYEKINVGGSRIREIYNEMQLEYGEAIRALRSQYRIEYGAIVEDHDHRYELITTAFDKDHIQKLWEEIYTIELDVLLANRKMEELKIRTKRDSDVIFTLFPTDDASLALKDQLIGIRMKYNDKVYATSLQN